MAAETMYTVIFFMAFIIYDLDTTNIALYGLIARGCFVKPCLF